MKIGKKFPIVFAVNLDRIIYQKFLCKKTYLHFNTVSYQCVFLTFHFKSFEIYFVFALRVSSIFISRPGIVNIHF